MSVSIHPTAIVDPGAELGSNVEIGPFSIVGGDVQLGDGVRLRSHVVIEGRTSVGAGSEIYPFAVLGCPPQHTRYQGEPSTLEIGANNVIREHVTMHPGTAIDAMKTTVGDNGLFLAATHVAHDCIVGDNAIFANNAALGGHVKIGDNVMLGGFSSVQQWCRVGDHAMVGSQTAVDADVIPFAIAVGNRALLTGINVIGLERRGFDPDDVDLLRRAFRDMFQRDGLFSERLSRLRDVYGRNPQVSRMIGFIDSAGRNGVCKAASKTDK